MLVSSGSEDRAFPSGQSMRWIGLDLNSAANLAKIVALCLQQTHAQLRQARQNAEHKILAYNVQMHSINSANCVQLCACREPMTCSCAKHARRQSVHSLSTRMWKRSINSPNHASSLCLQQTYDAYLMHPVAQPNTCNCVLAESL